MGTVAIRTEGLSKHYGSVRALEGPRSRGRRRRGRRLSRAERGGQDHDDPPPSRAHPPDAGRAEIFGLDCQRQVVAAHRELAYVAGEASLWPSLTGAETLHLLGRVQGSVDERYRDELIERFDLDPSKKVRTYSKGNRQKLILIAALMTRTAAPRARRADERARPAHGAGLSPLRVRGRERGQTIFLSSHILSEVEALCDRVGDLARGRSSSRWGRWPRCAISRPSRSRQPSTPRCRTSPGSPGVSSLEVVGHVVRCQVRGSIEPLLKVLASAGSGSC